MNSSASERQFTIRGLQLAAKQWHADRPQKILALHGWLDNAGSFDKLAPELGDCHIIAPDLFGQGLSDARPASATYHLWDDLSDILNLLDQLQWQRCTLIGHSRGAMLAVLFAACFPERVQQIILLDGLLPIAVDVADTVEQFRKHIVDYQPKSKAPRYFTSFEKAVELRAKVGGFSSAVAGHLAARQVAEGEGGWYWTADNRLKAASAIKLNEAHNRQILDKLACPVQIILASGGMGRYAPLTDLKQHYAHFQWYDLDGHHHFHIDGQVEEIAALCSTALSQL